MKLQWRRKKGEQRHEQLVDLGVKGEGSGKPEYHESVEALVRARHPSLVFLSTYFVCVCECVCCPLSQKKVPIKDPEPGERMERKKRI
jgi:hypothetical protein